MSCFRLTRSSKPREVPPAPIKHDPCTTTWMDPFVASELVAGLNDINFAPYLLNKDITMVMFYKTDDKQSAWSRRHFSKASQMTTRPRHAYAAVNCGQSDELCVTEGVPSLPYFKIYSKGQDVGYSSNPNKLLFSDMKTWVENFPVSLKEANDGNN